jgi:hypothetical protein
MKVGFKPKKKTKQKQAWLLRALTLNITNMNSIDLG